MTSMKKQARIYEEKIIPQDEMDLLRRTTDAFSQAVGKNISLHDTPSEMSYVCWETGKNRFSIGVDRNDDGLKKITKVEHELSHIIFKTSVRALDKAMGKILENTPDIAIEGFRNKCKPLAKQLYNILEDERCESNFGIVHAGSKGQFNLAKATHNKINKPDGEMDPIGAIFSARYLHNDLIDNTDWEIAKEYLEQVHFKDEKAGIILTKMYWDEVVVPWLNKKKDEMEPEPEPEQPKGFEASEEDGEKPDSKDGKSDSGKTEIEKSKDAIKARKEELAKRMKPKHVKEELEKILEEAGADTSGHERMTLDEADDIDWDDMKGELEMSKENLEGQIKELKDALENPIHERRDAEGRVLLEPLKDKLVEKIERPRNSATPDIPLSRGLNKMFKRIKGKFTDTIESAGAEIDMEEYIQARAKKSGEFWVEEVEAGGLEIVIGVDLSGSMGSHRISVCRNMCATLYKSLEGIEDVNLKIVAWSSPSEQYKLSVKDIVKYADVECISGASHHEQNANHLAHQYIDEMLRKSHSSKKLCIMLTDGVPWMETGRRGYSMETLLDLTKQAIDETRRHGNKVFGIYIGNNDTEIGMMQKMYGSDFVAVKEIEEARTNVVRAFEAHVVNQMRSV